MEVKMRSIKAGMIIDVFGDIDMKTSDALSAVLRELADKKTSDIIINLDHVNFMDSSGLAALVECLQKVREYNGRLRLFGLSKNLTEVIKIVKLDSIFSIFSTEKEALSD